jgi:hypothetical protein
VYLTPSLFEGIEEKHVYLEKDKEVKGVVITAKVCTSKI